MFYNMFTSRHDEEISARYKPKYSPAVFHTALDIALPETQQFGVTLDRWGFNYDWTFLGSAISILHENENEMISMFRYEVP